jgi:DNA invertase Pin-like site-specific DNA recombinase
MTAIGYIRQSRRADLDLALSRDAQLAAIRRLCDGCEILEDMGRSGKGGGERLRPGYQRLVAGIESGEYTDVYAIALSRFSRSVPELHGLMELAKAHGVRIVTAKEGTMDPHTATGRMIFNTWANFAEFVRDMAVEAANENVAIRRVRGDRMGRIPFGDRPGEAPALVLDAYRTAGSYNGAATLLNDAKVPPWRAMRTAPKPGGKPPLWTGTSVRLIVQRNAPELAPRHPAKGVGGHVSFALARLLRCSCGRFLTGYHHKAGRIVRYKCHAAETDSTHPRPYSLSESTILPWIMAEADRYTLPPEVERDAPGERDALEAQRVHVTRLALVPGVDLGTVTAQLAAIDERLAGLEDDAVIEEVGPIDWRDTPPAALNAQLRAYWRAVQLDEGMQPIEADWRVARMRADSGFAA